VALVRTALVDGDAVAPLLHGAAMLRGEDLTVSVVDPHDADLVPPRGNDPEEEQPHAIRLPRVETLR
jgi:hypothetical protein